MKKETGSLARGETIAFLASSLAGKFASCFGKYRQGKNGHIWLKNKLLNCNFHQLQEAPRCPAVATVGGVGNPNLEISQATEELHAKHSARLEEKLRVASLNFHSTLVQNQPLAILCRLRLIRGRL